MSLFILHGWNAKTQDGFILLNASYLGQSLVLIEFVPLWCNYHRATWFTEKGTASSCASFVSLMFLRTNGCGIQNIDFFFKFCQQALLGSGGGTGQEIRKWYGQDGVRAGFSELGPWSWWRWLWTVTLCTKRAAGRINIITSQEFLGGRLEIRKFKITYGVVAQGDHIL